MKLAPIALFTYNRPQHTKETIEALCLNELANESDLIIFSDAAKNDIVAKGVNETRQYLKTVTGFKSIQIIERESNYGLGNSIIDGVSKIVSEYGRVIVLEDDLLTSPYFLRFMNESLNKYENTDDVISVHGYVYPIKEELPENFFLIHTDSLGWGTWKRAWKFFNPNGQEILDQIEQKKISKEFNFNSSYDFIKMLKKQIKKENNSWAIRWYGSAFLANKLSLFPQKSLVFHNGGDNTGTNCVYDSWLDVDLSEKEIPVLENLPLEENKKVRYLYESFFKTVKIPLTIKIKNKIIKLCR